ncbi:hypothetical protein TNCV_58501 [Trichonephila clavipes]|nr:hypothetical protein TNCV_58501 [Trichonephila clavipes]
MSKTVKNNFLRRQHYKATEELLAKDLMVVNLSQVTRTTPRLAPPAPSTRRVFSGTRTQTRSTFEFATIATRLQRPQNAME